MSSNLASIPPYQASPASLARKFLDSAIDLVEESSNENDQNPQLAANQLTKCITLSYSHLKTLYPNSSIPDPSDSHHSTSIFNHHGNSSKNECPLRQLNLKPEDLLKPMWRTYLTALSYSALAQHLLGEHTMAVHHATTALMVLNDVTKDAETGYAIPLYIPRNIMPTTKCNSKSRTVSALQILESRCLYHRSLAHAALGLWYWAAQDLIMIAAVGGNDLDLGEPYGEVLERVEGELGKLLGVEEGVFEWVAQGMERVVAREFEEGYESGDEGDDEMDVDTDKEWDENTTTGLRSAEEGGEGLIPDDDILDRENLVLKTRALSTSVKKDKQIPLRQVLTTKPTRNSSMRISKPGPKPRSPGLPIRRRPSRQKNNSAPNVINNSFYFIDQTAEINRRFAITQAPGLPPTTPLPSNPSARIPTTATTKSGPPPPVTWA